MERREKEIGALVIDTNIVISSLIPAKSKLRDVLLSGKIKFRAPEYLLKELDKYWDIVVEKAEKKGVARVDLDLTKEELLSKIIFETEKTYSPKIQQAYNICKKFDEKDTPFVALSLALGIPS